MRIQICVKANAKREAVEKMADGSFRVLVKAPAKEGRANEAVIRVLSEYFNVSRSSVTIVGGKQSKKKHVKIA